VKERERMCGISDGVKGKEREVLCSGLSSLISILLYRVTHTVG